MFVAAVKKIMSCMAN